MIYQYVALEKDWPGESTFDLDLDEVSYSCQREQPMRVLAGKKEHSRIWGVSVNGQYL